jgi:acyl-ACP thioesterase
VSSPALDVELVPRPGTGRVYRTTRRVRLADVTPTGRARFDALARYLQDIARDDSADSALENPMGWVVRRTAVRVDRWPVFQEGLEIATWCSGIGPRWAERRTTIVGEAGGLVEAVTLWVHVDPVTGRPARLVAGFADRYAEAAAGRGADAKLVRPAEPPPGAVTRPWPLRRTDFDVLGHVNNAAYWAGLEELLGAEGPVLPAVALVEHRSSVEPGAAVVLAQAADHDGVAWWIVGDAGAAAAGWCGPAVG